MLGCIDPSVVPDNPFKSLRLLNPGTSGRAERLNMVALIGHATSHHEEWAAPEWPKHGSSQLNMGIAATAASSLWLPDSGNPGVPTT